MNATWHLIQYTADMRRKEPRNIGVAVTVGDECAIKFFGVEAGGRIDGRQLRRYGLSQDAYSDWVNYYTTMLLHHRDAARVLDSQRRRPTEFRLILAGQSTSADNACTLAERLYRELVAGEESTASEQWSRVLKQRVDAALSAAQVQTTADVEVGARWGEGDADAVTFDYRCGGEQPALMDRLQLHRVNLESAKSVAREFNARVTAARSAGARDKFIAFYSGQAVEQMASPTILTPIRGVANVIDVDNEERAVDAIHYHLGATA
ncbi:hypothetical protein [Nocardia camponoti]|uniref:DUF3037 domain-containing protein n=1 Tax=Nocardia camponoti TaxID=1616106 RepID=A0A917VA62_9NOCA|nr:hypothetical protein [Nocardia camponoti]GGK54858.1 hypothetical protein GCM10011591_28410 [Nocardia camponoti]